MYATFGIVFFILKTCHADFTCYYHDLRELTCQECCKYDCCENNVGSGLSGGAIAGIIIGVVILFALHIFCICLRTRRHQQQTILRRTVVTDPRSIVVTNTLYAGYDQTRIPTIHQTNSNQRGLTGIKLTNPNHVGYDQQVPNFEPVVPPPPYESVAKELQK